MPNRTRPFVKGARGDGIDAKAKGIAIHIGCIGGGEELCVGDFFDGIFCAAGDGGDGGQDGAVINGVNRNLNQQRRSGSEGAVVGGDGEGV